MKFKSRVWVCRNHFAGAGKRFFKINTALKKIRHASLTYLNLRPSPQEDPNPMNLAAAAISGLVKDEEKYVVGNGHPRGLVLSHAFYFSIVAFSRRKARLSKGQVSIAKSPSFAGIRFIRTIPTSLFRFISKNHILVCIYTQVPTFFFMEKMGCSTDKWVLYRQIWPKNQQALSAFARSCVGQI